MKKTIWFKIALTMFALILILFAAWFVLTLETRQIQNDGLKKLEAAEKNLIYSKDLKLYIVQIQQWLTDISATRAAPGYDDGYAEAENYFKLSLSTLETLKANKVIDDQRFQEISNAVIEFYNSGKAMANLYITKGPSAGNNEMEIFDGKSENLQALLTPLYEKISKENLSTYATIKQDLDSLSSNLLAIFLLLIVVVLTSLIVFGKSISASLKTINLDLLGNMESLRESSVNLSLESERMNNVIVKQSASLSETIESVEDIHKTINANLHAVEESVSVSKKSTELANSGKDAMTAMIVSMEEIRESNATIMSEANTNNEDIGRIIKMISEIGTKTQVINDIVFQTKLLSFNASVEAARAGEQGKGFAVVAEEVGNLASMSGKAALEISEMLSTSIEEVKSIIETSTSRLESLVKKSKEKIDSGIEKANVCNTSLDAILDNVQKGSEESQAISSASHKQSEKLTEINRSVKELELSNNETMSVSSQNLDMAERLTQQAESLGHIVIHLTELVSRKQEDSELKDSHEDLELTG